MAQTIRERGLLPRAAHILAPGLLWAVLLAIFSVPQPWADLSRASHANVLLPLSITPSAPTLRPATGRFLIASRGMRDPRFAQTVILLVEHGAQGTRGLIINRRTTVTLAAALPEIGKGGSVLLYWGGPVQVQAMSLVVRSDSDVKGANRILEGVHFATSMEALENAIARGTGDSRLRVFAGFSGWAPGQLDQELERGDWHVMEARPEEVFHEQSAEIWPTLIRRAEAEWVWLPADPRLAEVSRD